MRPSRQEYHNRQGSAERGSEDHVVRYDSAHLCFPPRFGFGNPLRHARETPPTYLSTFGRLRFVEFVETRIPQAMDALYLYILREA
jgi:hypothetical protein